MIGRLNHVAIAVPDLGAATTLYAGLLQARVSAEQVLPEHGVRLVFVDLPNTRIELMEPFGDASPLTAFLQKNPRGGIHHVCYEVASIADAASRLVAGGARVLGDGKPRIGAHGNPVLFLHPADFLGTLVELEEVPQWES